MNDNVNIRPIREDELAETLQVGYRSQGNDDLADALEPGFVSSVMRHLYETGTMMVAVTEDETMIGFGASMMRDGSCFLSQLFVLPGRQAAGAGYRLLEAVMPPGTEPRATVSSTDPRAIALYIRAGLLPQWSHFDLAGDSDALRDLPDGGVTIVEGSGYDEEIAAWDAEISGRLRPEEHRYLLEHRGGIPLWFERGGQRIGYGYANVLSSSDNAVLYGDTISLGPLGVRDEADALACTLAAVRWSAERGKEITIELSGPHPALRPLIDARMRIFDFQTFMASDVSRFGDPRRYVPTGGAFF